MRKIYIASSWKNAKGIRILAYCLRNWGHEVFDFTDSNSNHRPGGFDNFVFHASQWLGKPLSEINWIEFLESKATERAFDSDKAGLDWADTCILFLPSGRSSHIEAGYAVGQGKDLFIYGDLPKGEFDAMYLFAKGWFLSCSLSHLRLALDGGK